MCVMYMCECMLHVMRYDYAMKHIWYKELYLGERKEEELRPPGGEVEMGYWTCRQADRQTRTERENMGTEGSWKTHTHIQRERPRAGMGPFIPTHLVHSGGR